MGQLVGVVEKPSSTPGVVRFELNRSLSGMGHERYRSGDPVIGDKPSAMVARGLFASGKVDAVHVYGNMVTVDVTKGYDADGLSDIVVDMYTYWRPGVEPPTFDDLPADDPADAAPVDANDPLAGAAALGVPMHLLERGKAARERWAAKQG